MSLGAKSECKLVGLCLGIQECRHREHCRENEGQNHRMGKHYLPSILTRSLLKELLWKT